MKVELAQIDDFDSIMKLVDLVKGSFPGLDDEIEYIHYKEILKKNIKRESAICVKFVADIVGILLFSIKGSTLSFLAVHPDWRKKGIATSMIRYMLPFFKLNTDIVVSTFRENDEKGIAPRALYKKLGFIEGELCEEFDYPNQKFILHRIVTNKK